jgi:Uri superfamily endonuclease
MNYGKTIKIFLPTGRTDEIKIASIANSTVQATLIPRNVLGMMDEYPEINSTGIYFLLDSEQNVYVGEAESVSNRIKQHSKDAEKDWWNTVITINVNSINSPLSKGDIKYLEHFSFEAINSSERFSLDQTIPTKASVSRDRQADLMHVFEDIKILVSTLGYHLFERKRRISDSTKDKEALVFYLESKMRNGLEVSASGEFNSEGFLIYAGSKISKNQQWMSKVFANNISNMKETEDGLYYILEKDIQAWSPSMSAAMVTGRGAINGYAVWKTKEGKSLDEIYRKEEDRAKRTRRSEATDGEKKSDNS